MNYEVTVLTSDRAWACTMNNVYIKLVGTRGESERTHLSGTFSFTPGAKSSFTVTCHAPIGNLVLIELDKQPILFLPHDNWFPDKVEVKSPEGETYSFPIYSWINDNKKHRFREGTARRVYDDYPLGLDNRKKELKQRKEDYCWGIFKEGLPRCVKAHDVYSLPSDVHFSFTKKMEFKFTSDKNLFQSTLYGLTTCTEKWSSIDQLTRVFGYKALDLPEFIRDHWKDDDIFGYQFLNGVDPIMIRRCKSLPSNFPVTDNMLRLYGQRSLADEVKKGNIFLCDYKILDGVKPNIINGKQQYLMAPLVLLQKTPDDKMMPVAIQLKQKPGEDNPIFFPSDSEYDWLLAKIFVRSAEFSVHQLNTHLLRTHLLAEVFTVSLLRNVPMVHPLYKLLIPHTRYTVLINFLARIRLISDEGVFTKFTAAGGEGMITILKKSLSSMTYRSLCIPDDITDRGLQDVPNFYYRDDGLRLWDIIHRFVKRILGHYYKNNDEVVKDIELQDWIKDIFEHGFLSQASTGIPQRFATVDELVTFVTMVIFTCSAQHAAVNSGQYDFGGWMPNTPISLQLPPPTKKGEATEATMLATFPDVNATVQGMDSLWLLSRQSKDFVPLGKYPEDHFTEEFPQEAIRGFQRDLKELSESIQKRNKELTLPYTYLDPAKVENSVSL